MHCNVCNRYRKLKKKSYISKKTSILSIVYSTCGHEYEKIFEEDKSTKILKVRWMMLLSKCAVYNSKKTKDWRR